MSISVHTSPSLLKHLSTYQVDGATVEGAFFADGRLQYPGRAGLELEYNYVEPYTLKQEARVIEGLGIKANACIRMLSSWATASLAGTDPTVDFIWEAHDEYQLLAAHDNPDEGPSLDRLLAALVAVHELKDETVKVEDDDFDQILLTAAVTLVQELHRVGLPPTHAGLEEIFDGAEPAVAALGCVEVA